MKFDYKKFSQNDVFQALLLAVITVSLIVLIIECPVSTQFRCTGLVIIAVFFNLLRRKEDSVFSQIRIPLLTGFALIANKLKTSLDLIFRPEVLDISKINQLNFENSSLVLLIVFLLFALAVGFIIWMIVGLEKGDRDVTRLESLLSDKKKNFSLKLPIVLARVLCVITIIGGILSAVARPLYLRIVTGSFDFITFQQTLLLSSFDMYVHSLGIAILYMSVGFFNTSFTTEQGGFLITDDKRIIKYKGKSKVIYVPRDFKLFMTDTFENCDSTYEIHFEEGTTEIPPLKFKKSFPIIVYPSSLTSLREYSLFIKGKNPYDNSTTITMLLNNPVFKIIDGCMINTKNNTLLFRTEYKDSDFTLLDCVENVGKYAFDDLLLAKAYCSDESRLYEIKGRIQKYANFSNGKDKEYDEYATAVVTERPQLKKISFTKNISYVHPDALELATGLREIYIPEDSDFDISESNPSRPYIKYLGKGKKITHRMIERLLHIHEKIKSGCYPNSKQLAYDLETSEPTINRDIEYLRDSRYAPIQYDFTNRGYYYTEDYELFFEK